MDVPSLLAAAHSERTGWDQVLALCLLLAASTLRVTSSELQKAVCFRDHAAESLG